MSFDFGFDFRATAGYVTDPAYAAPVLGEAYPHTYSNANGLSIVGGYTISGFSTIDLLNTNDPRLAGVNYNSYNNSGGFTTFRIDLPHPGSWTIQLAAGDATSAQQQYVGVYDNAGIVLYLNNINTATNNFVDAGLNNLTAATWISSNTPVTLTFATSTLFIQLGPTLSPVSSLFTTIAHLRITESAVVPPTIGIVNAWSNIFSDSPTGIETLPVSPANGHALIVGITKKHIAGYTISSVQDNHGNNLVADIATPYTDGTQEMTFYRLQSCNNVTSIILTLSSVQSVTLAMLAMEVVGLNSITPLDALSPPGLFSATSNPNVGAGITTTKPYDLIIGLNYCAIPNPFGANTPWACIPNVGANLSATYRVAPTAGGYNPTSISDGTHTVLSISAAYQAGFLSAIGSGGAEVFEGRSASSVCEFEA